MLLTEAPGAAFSGELTTGSYSPLAVLGTVTEGYTATCIAKVVKKGKFSGSVVNFD
jgi:hypothetical protein